MRKDTQILNLGRIAALLLGLACAASAQAGGTEAYTGDRPQSVATADFNADGMPDLAVVNMNDDNVGVLLNTTASGSPDISLAAEQTFATGNMPIAAAAADVNGDGKPDLIVVNCGDATVTVLINTTVPGSSTVSFTAGDTFAVGNTPIWVMAADLNGDGRVDIVTTNVTSSSLSVLLNTTSNGSSTAAFDADQELLVGQMPNAVVAVDVNGDGLPDLATANYLDNTVSVLLNGTATGSDTVSFADQQLFAAGNGPQSIATGDINGDGLPDLVVVGGNDNTVAVLLNITVASSTTVGFADQQIFYAANSSQSVVIRDVNGDGLADVIVANEDGSDVALLVNTTATGSATAGFLDEQDFARSLGGGLTSVAAIDMNGDGLPELVAVNTNTDDVSVLLNATAPGDTTLDFIP